jgi:GNAT superfamily N-acetyltransferase
MSRLQSGITIRHPIADDIYQTLALLMRCEIPEYGLEGLRQEWDEMDLTQDAWLAFSHGEDLVGYATVTPYQAGLCYHVYIDPAWTGIALNRILLQECDRRARSRIAAQAGPSSLAVTTWIAHGNDRDRQAVEGAGFQLAKCSFEMRIDMEHQLPKPRWPEGIRVRSTVPGQDDRAIWQLMAAAFAGTHLEPCDFVEWRDAMMSGAYFDADLWFLALHGEKIIGACLCAVYPEQQQAWIRQLAVATQWRRHGVARALLLHAFRAFYERGHPAVWIGVEADTIAHRLYEQVGMRRVQQFDEYQKKIDKRGS